MTGVQTCALPIYLHGSTIRNLTTASFGEDLVAAMAEAAAHAQGVGTVARVHTVEVPDVRAIR